MDKMDVSTQNQTEMTLDEAAESRLYAAKISLGVNLFIALYEWMVGRYHGSHSIFADALHTGSDGLTDLLLISGFTLAASLRYRRISGAIDKGMSAIVGILIILMAGRIALTSLTAASTIRGPFVAAALLIPLIVTKGYVSYFKIKTGKATGSLALTTDGYHSALDSLSTVAVVGSLILAGYGVTLDRLVALGIAVLIFWIGYNAVAPVWRSLELGSVLGDRLCQEFSSLKNSSFSMGLSRVKDAKEIRWIREHPRQGLTSLTIFVLVIYLFSGVTVIQIGETGLVFRFNKFVDVWESGLHYAPPFPVGNVIRTRALEPRRAEIGFRLGNESAQSGSVLLWENTFLGSNQSTLTAEAMHLTGDVVVLNVTAVVQYVLADPASALIKIENVDAVVKTAGEAALTASISTLSSDQILTGAWDKIENNARQQAQAFLDSLAAGVRVTAVEIISVQPPPGVLASYRDVASAREEKETAVNLAQAYRNEELPRARGQSQADTIAATAYAATAMAEAEGRAGAFSSVASVYRLNPASVRFDLMWESAEETLPRRDKLIYDASLSGVPTVFDLYLPERAR